MPTSDKEVIYVYEEIVTQSEMDQYNGIVKGLLATPEKERIIKLKDYNKLKDIRSRMNNVQKKDALPFPNIPPPPKSPLDHIVDMAKRGATFYVEGKKVSSDAAIKYVKEHRYFQLKTDGTNSKKPTVYISKSKKKELIDIIKESENRGPSVGDVTQSIGEKVKRRVEDIASAQKAIDKRKKIFITISKSGTFKIAFTEKMKDLRQISLEEIETLVSNLSKKEIANTFIFASSGDFKKFRSKPSNFPAYQDDIEISLIKDNIRYETHKLSGKLTELRIAESVKDNKIGNLEPHIEKLATIFRRYGIKNMTL